MYEFIEWILFFRSNQKSIDFELKNFKRVFNQSKEALQVWSPKYKFGEYDWSIIGYTDKNPNANNELWFLIALRCVSENQSVFPFYAKMTCSILNKDKDLRKDCSMSNFFLFK